MPKTAIDKYLTHYAEPEIGGLQQISSRYQYALVVPICNESTDCLKTICQAIKTQHLLIIAIVNSPTPHENRRIWQKNNQQWIQSLLKNSTNHLKINARTTLLNCPNFHDVLLIDRNSFGNQIACKQGVGLARKIGADCALKLFQLDKIKQPWIFSTDADVSLPKNYFELELSKFTANSAIVLDFVHHSTDAHMKKLQFLYDFKMRYYLAGIVYAGSGYQYIPLGSTVIIAMTSYAQVRGFPKKNAAEDFYLLNKLNKTKAIHYNIQNCRITIQSRFSNRVVFGTGPALTAIVALEKPMDYPFYHPNCFIMLKQWLQFLSSLWQEKLIITPPQETLLAELYHHLNCHIVFNKSKPQITSQQRWTQFVHQWFDAFRTLKAIHFFHKKFKPLTIQQLLNHPSFAKVNNLSLQTFLENLWLN